MAWLMIVFYIMVNDRRFYVMVNDRLFYVMVNDRMFYVMVNDRLFYIMVYDSMFYVMVNDRMFYVMVNDRLFYVMVNDVSALCEYYSLLLKTDIAGCKSCLRRYKYGYKPNESYKRKCRVCTCSKGGWNCDNNACTGKF